MRVDMTGPDEEHGNVPDRMPVHNSYSHLTGLSRKIAILANRPALIVYALIVPISLLAWMWMILAPHVHMTALIAPTLPQPDLSLQKLTVMFSMWIVMVIAMMLPTAAPMLRTYADIADAAAQKADTVIPIVILASGYLLVWVLFSVMATLLQATLIAAGGLAGPSAPLTGLAAGIVLIIAGAYQFTPFKHACLVKCRNPFTLIFGQWSTKRRDIFHLGRQQGWFCLGCCWAMMLIMLVAGTMNFVWMAVLTLITIWEKSAEGNVVSWVFGVGLLAWGLFLAATSATLVLT